MKHFITKHYIVNKKKKKRLLSDTNIMIFFAQIVSTLKSEYLKLLEYFLISII